jgi:hypothetical protein
MYRRDLELAPGTEFRLRRRLSSRVLSGALALAAAAFGAYDLVAGRYWVGAGTLVLAIAFMVQLTLAEMDFWKFEERYVVRRLLTLRGVAEERLHATEIRGVHVAFAKGRARAFIETMDGDEVPLVEGNEAEVRRVADKLNAVLMRPPGFLH